MYVRHGLSLCGVYNKRHLSIYMCVPNMEWNFCSNKFFHLSSQIIPPPSNNYHPCDIITKQILYIKLRLHT